MTKEESCITETILSIILIVILIFVMSVFSGCKTCQCLPEIITRDIAASNYYCRRGLGWLLLCSAGNYRSRHGYGTCFPPHACYGR